MRVHSKQGSAGGFTPKVHMQTESVLSATAVPTEKSGGFFTFVIGAATPAVGGCTGFQTYTVVEQPANVGQSGQRGFFSDQSGVIRYTTDGCAPTIASPPVQ